jgi:hypothetical protein
VIRRTLLLPVFAAAALGLVACNGGGTSGNTGSANTTTAGSAPSSNGSTDSTSGPLASVNPCSLLTASEKSQAGLSKENKVTESKIVESQFGERGCSWDKTGQYTIAFYLYGKSGGLQDVPASAGQLTKQQIGNHDGMQVVNQYGCGILIGVTPHTRVDVDVTTASDDSTQECSIANNYAKIIEPQLPAQQQ